MTRRGLSALAGLLGGLLLLPGPGFAEVPKVVTDIAPVHSLVAQVMEGVGAPVQLMDKGADAHHFSLRPSQARALQQADLVVWVGPEMTPWLEGALGGAGARAVLSLLAAEGTARLEFGAAAGAHGAGGHGPEDHAQADHVQTGHAQTGHAQDGSADVGHDHGSHAQDGHADHPHDGDAPHDHGGASKPHDEHMHGDHDAHGHSHEGIDPHAWLDPANAIAWLELIAAELSRLDPDNAERYRANAETARHALTELDARIAAKLAPLAAKPFVVAHDAYGYFAAHYGLHLAGAISGGDAAAPGAGRLRDLRAGLAAEGAVCAFSEVGRDPGLVKLVVEGSATRLGPALDPEGRDIAPGPALYAALISGLAEDVSGCLSAQD